MTAAAPSEPSAPTTSDSPSTTPATEPSQTALPIQDASWRSGLPDDLRDHEYVKGHESLEALVKHAVNQNSLIGRKGVVLPKEGDENDQARFYNELGRPSEAEGYDFQNVEMPEGLPVSHELIDRMKAHFHAAGASQAQAEKVVQAYLGELSADYQVLQTRQSERASETTGMLQREWGQAYEQKRQFAARAATELFGDLLGPIATATFTEGDLAGTRVGDHPDFIRGLYEKLGKSMEEDGIAGGERVPVSSPADARAEINRLLNDPEFQKAYYDSNHPEHRAHVERLAVLYRQENPEE